MRPPRAVAISTLAVLTAVGACASESDLDGVNHAADGRSLSDYLAAIPAPDDRSLQSGFVIYGDIARAAAIGDVDIPDDVSDKEAVVDFLTAIQGYGGPEGPAVATALPEVAQPGHIERNPQGFVDDVGWSIVDVDSFAELHDPGRPVSLLDGSFDRDALAAALDDAGDGLWVAGDPERGMDLLDSTPARPTGQALWHSLDGDRLIVTPREAQLAAARDGDGKMLADVVPLATVATALDEREVYSAYLLVGAGIGPDRRTVVVDEGATPSHPEDPADPPRCPGVTGVGVGVAHDDGGPLIVLAMAHGDASTAETNVALVAHVLTEGKNPALGFWSDLLTVESVEAEGTVVVATMRPAGMVLSQWHWFMSLAFPPC